MSTRRSQLPIVVITIGDAAGIGPEVIVKALALRPEAFYVSRPLVVGDVAALTRTASQLGVATEVRSLERVAEAEFRLGGIDGISLDSSFFRACCGGFDCVLAMYNDQGQSPAKVLGLEGGVNVSLGLPIVRTSVDHVTAFDLAGQVGADEGSLVSAIREAASLAT